MSTQVKSRFHFGGHKDKTLEELREISKRENERVSETRDTETQE